MSKEMREQIDRIRSFGKFLNENVEVNYNKYENALNILFEYHLTLDEVSDFAETQLNLQRNGYVTMEFLKKIHELWNLLSAKDKYDKMINFKYSESNLLTVLNRMTIKKKNR